MTEGIITFGIISPVTHTQDPVFFINFIFHDIIDDIDSRLTVVDLPAASPYAVSQQQCICYIHISVCCGIAAVRISELLAVVTLLPCHQMRADTARVSTVVAEESVKYLMCFIIGACSICCYEHTVAVSFRNGYRYRLSVRVSFFGIENIILRFILYICILTEIFIFPVTVESCGIIGKSILGIVCYTALSSCFFSYDRFIHGVYLCYISLCIDLVCFNGRF